MESQDSSGSFQGSASNTRSGNKPPKQPKRKSDVNASNTRMSTDSTRSSSTGNGPSPATMPAILRGASEETERTDSLRDLEQRGDAVVPRLKLDEIQSDLLQEGAPTVTESTAEDEEFRSSAATYFISSSRTMGTEIGTDGSINDLGNRKSPQCKFDAPDNTLSYRAAEAPETTTPMLEKTNSASSNLTKEFLSPIKVVDGQDKHDVARHDEGVTRKGMQSTSQLSNKSTSQATATETLQQQQSSSKFSDKQSSKGFADKLTPAVNRGPINGGSYRQSVQPAKAAVENSDSGRPTGTTSKTFGSTKITSNPLSSTTSVPRVSTPCSKSRGVDGKTATTIFAVKGKQSKDCRGQSSEGSHQNGNSSAINNNTVLDATMIKILLSTMPKLTLSNFELKETIGTGTFGRVRMCKLKQNSTIPLALKIIKKSEVIRLMQVEHMKSEKNILQSIHHPFIVNLFATFQDRKNLFMLMEFVQGGELFTVLKAVGKLKNDRARFYASEIVLALEYLHSRDIAYRDIKPENLLIDSEGHIKITDFGFAKVVTGRTWTTCGTPEYMAPEVFGCKGHGKSADWWALGILIFEMLVGYPPFYDDTHTNIYAKALAGRINFPKWIDPAAKDLITSLLSVDLSNRIGCLRRGAEDVKQHFWFRSIDWDQCLKRQLKPPFIPEMKSPEDTSMFDPYPDSTEGSAPNVTSAEQELFAYF